MQIDLDGPLPSQQIVSCAMRQVVYTELPAGETVRFTLYRLLQELLNNVCKHAEASEVAIVLYQQGAMLHL